MSDPTINIALYLGGFAIATFLVFCLFEGVAYDHYFRRYTRNDEPFLYWLITGWWISIAVLFFWFIVVGKIA